MAPPNNAMPAAAFPRMSEAQRVAPIPTLDFQELSSHPVSLISKETLKDWMNNGSVIVLDARRGRDWSSSEFKIKGARRTAPGKFSNWKSDFSKDQKLVLYCA